MLHSLLSDNYNKKKIEDYNIYLKWDIYLSHVVNIQKYRTLWHGKGLSIFTVYLNRWSRKSISYSHYPDTGRVCLHCKHYIWVMVLSLLSFHFAACKTVWYVLKIMRWFGMVLHKQLIQTQKVKRIYMNTV